MRILVDLQGAQNGSRHRGIGRYSLALAKAIARNRGAHEIYIVLNALFPETIDEIRGSFAGLLPDHHILVFHAPGPVDELVHENAWRLHAAELIREKFLNDLAPDLVLICSLVEGASDNTIASIGQLFSNIPTAVVLYDLIPFLDPEKYIGWAPAKSWYYRKIDALKRADLLLAISASAQQEAIDNLGFDLRHVTNISSAVDDCFAKKEMPSKQRSALLEKYGIKRKFLMHSSAFDERKNFEGLVRAFGTIPEKIRKNYQLVLVCKINDAGRQTLNNLAFESGLRKDELVLTGFVPDDELVALYSECHLFVFPSFHEGFGLPALEAMNCGAAVIGSNNSSIPEVIGRKDALFDPKSTADMAKIIERALVDSAFWQSLKEHATIQSKKFSWDSCAKTAIARFEELHLESPSQATTYKTDDLAAIIEEICKPKNGIYASEKDIAEAACAIDKNETTTSLTRSYADLCGELKWRVEGPFDSTYSLALVNREQARAISALGHLVVLHSTEGPGDFAPSANFLQNNPDLAVMNARVRSYPHAATDVASRLLYPPRVADMSSNLNLLHNYAWEESGFPQQWVHDFNKSLDGILCCSSHVEKVMLDNGVSVPMATTSIGTDHWERVEAAADYHVEGRKFRFLHVSSCFPRKGVELLLDAYGNTFSSQDDVSLIIKTFKNPHNEIDKWLLERRENNPRYPHVIIIEGDLSDGELKALYQQCQVLVAPSRAEGFGLPLAEAMLSGLPVITTAWSGQLDFCNTENSWLVDYQFEPAKTHFELFTSVWAKIDVDELGKTLGHVHDLPPAILKAKALAGRELLLESHRWSHVAGRSIDWMRAWQANKNKSIDLRIGWISTWNTKCGIAAYSEHLISRMSGNISVLAPRQDGRIRPDESFCIRCWNSEKDNNDLDAAADYITRRSLNTIVIQFNYSFYNFSQLSDFIELQLNDGRIVIVMMHSTTDPLGDTPNWKLVELLPAFQRCHRVLVHSVADLNRMKILGLVNNVALFPHGIVKYQAVKPVKHRNQTLIASYGFCLPHKGMLEMIEATALLKQQGKPVRLRLVTAEYPHPVSAELIVQMKALAQRLGVSDLVEMYTDFLDDNQSMDLLQDADLVVFAYQQTGESSSAAVRSGLASGRPVAVTPLSIFDDVGGAVFRFPGTTPELIAQGITETLFELSSDSARAQQNKADAQKWIEAHDYQKISDRLLNICLGLARKLHSRVYRFHGSSPQLKTLVGKAAGKKMVSTGVAGNLLHGPYVTLPSGRYQVYIHGAIGLGGAGGAYADFVFQGDEKVLARANLTRPDAYGRICSFTVTLPKRGRDCEIRVWVNATSTVSVSLLEIVPVPASARPLENESKPVGISANVRVFPEQATQSKSGIRNFLINKLKRAR